MNLLQRIRDHARSARLPDGTRVFLRPLREADLKHAQEYFGGLSEQSKYLRFMTPTPTLTAETLQRVVEALHADRAGITVAIVERAGEEVLIGGARIVPMQRRATCEFALSIVDEWQGRGLGTILMREAVRLGRQLGYHRIEGTVLTINSKMLKVAQRLKFHLHVDPQDPGVTIVTRALLP
ncbi:MAG: GNAT family N-acetyltransferase [Proteobacteria bacterium]|nr:GNAT family N-acetyltransferase [Pseudomonadota bacterium]